MVSIPRSFAAVGLLFATALLAAPAIGAPIVIDDRMDSAATFMGGDYGAYSDSNFSNRSAGGRHWGDELSSPADRFDTKQISVNRDDAAHTITFTLRTMFNGNDLGARYADLFFDTSSPNALDGFGYAVALGGQTKAAGVYGVDAYATSNDVWSGRSGYVYGGYSQLKTDATGFDPLMAVANPVRVTQGALLDGFNVVLTSAAAGDGYWDVAVAITTAGSLALFDAIDLFWATGDCGNDVIWGTALTSPDAGIPAPDAFLIFAAGLGFLLLLAARRRVRQAAPQGHSAGFSA